MYKRSPSGQAASDEVMHPGRCRTPVLLRQCARHTAAHACTASLRPRHVQPHGALARRLRRLTLLGIAVLGTVAQAAPCWESAAMRHGVDARLLYAIARTESSLDARALNVGHRTRTGSYDIGLMQINSRHLPRLARLGISEADLFDACTNLQVGAWLMADLFSRLGVGWDAVGAYNASCTALKGAACTRARTDYAWKVYRNLPASGFGMERSQTAEHRLAEPAVPGMTVRVTP